MVKRSPKKNRGITRSDDAKETLLELWAEESRPLNGGISTSYFSFNRVQNKMKCTCGNSEILKKMDSLGIYEENVIISIV